MKQIMVRSFKPKPVAQCSDCKKTTRSKERIDKNCYEQNKGTRCQGTFKSMPDESDWAACQPCNGVGMIENNLSCPGCRGDGWVSMKV